MKPHKILFVITTSDFGGTESYLLRLVAGLDRKIFEPIVLSLCPTGRIGREIAGLGIRVESFDMATKPKPHQMLAGVLRLWRFVRRENIELVQALLYRANVMAATALKLPGCHAPLVTGQRSLIPAGRGRDARLQRWTRGWAAKVVAVSQAVQRELLATEAIAPGKVVVIQNGIELSRFRIDPAEEQQRRAAARADWGVDEDKIVIGAVGRLHGPKGLKYLIEAFALAVKQDPRLQLVIAGDGPEREALESQAATLGVEVRFLGYQANPIPLYPGFDLYVLPSLAEGSPNALLEAMAAGKACIASRVGGVPEAAEDGQSGILVEPADPAALARAILDLAANPERRQELGLAARIRVEQEFDLEKKVRQHEALYLGLL